MQGEAGCMHKKALPSPRHKAKKWSEQTTGQMIRKQQSGQSPKEQNQKTARSKTGIS